MSYVCADCRNIFIQAPVCTTCGAQKMIDRTIKRQFADIDRLRAELAEAKVDAERRYRRLSTTPRHQS